MKVLLVINSLKPGGAEKLLADSIVKFKEKGLETDLLLLDSMDTPFYEKLKSRVSLNVHELGSSNNVYSYKNIWRVKKIMHQYDLVHVHLFPAFYITAIARFFSFRKPKMVYTEHNTSNKRRNRKLLKPIERFMYRQYARIITISDAVHDNLVQHLGKKFQSRIVKIYNGIDLKEIAEAQPYQKSELGYQQKDTLLLQVSSFTPQKDQDTLIRAMEHLPSDYKLLFAGVGPLQDSCKDLAKALKVSDRVHFLGSRADVPKLLKTVDVVVLSSHFEGLSLASVEGMASGKPFLASDVPGLKEVVTGGGLLFTENDEVQLAELIREVTENKEKASLVVDRALEKSKLFDINNMTDSYINEYSKL